MSTSESSWGIGSNTDAVPNLLRKFNRWLCWAAVHSGNKVSKVPRQCDNPRLGASVTNRNHWSSFENALVASQNGVVNGLGFVLTDIRDDDGNIVAIDLDRCVNDNVIANWAQEICDALPGYWELSPSGNGLRSFHRGELPGPSFLNRDEGVEIYNGDSSRYVTVTGRRLATASTDVEWVDRDALSQIYYRYRPSSFGGSAGTLAPMPTVLPDADEVQVAAALVLNSKFVDYLETGAIDDAYKNDNSSIIFALCQALFGHGFTDEEVLALLTSNDVCMEVADRHWKGKADRYLWRTAQSAKSKGGFAHDVADDFEVLVDPASTRSNLRGTLQLSRFDREAIPAREWLLEHWIPSGVVTLLYGDGGVGKSLLSLELQTCVALGTDFFGIEVTQGESLGIYCEDDEHEIARRQQAINEKHWSSFEEVGRHASWVSRLGAENVLMAFDGKSIGTKTPFYKAIDRVLRERRPKLVVFDTVSDGFAGNENSRSEVTQFITMLGGLAREHHTAVVACAHPSRSGMNTGEGGSTGWSNRARSRMHLKTDPDRPSVRVLELPKANYGQRTEDDKGPRLELLWHDGAFVRTDDEVVQDVLAVNDDLVDGLFVELARGCINRDEPLSDSINAGNYAPKKLAALARADGRRTTQVKLQSAMDRLLLRGRVAFIDHRHNGRDRRQLVINEHEEISL